jgi:GDSL-like Lipase/Acylhydrolase
MIKNIKLLLLVSLTFIACNDDEATVTYDSTDGLPLTAGTADFSKYVALGDSYAAGFSDGALFIEGQKGAYPNILAQQFALVGGGEFKTPFMADNTGGFIGGNPSFGPRLAIFGFNPNGTPIILSALGTTTTNPTTILTGSFNNMGIPGAKSFHLDFVGYGSSAGNPYFARFASTPGATVVADALAQNPTFFSLWIGGNDVLGYALTGGDGTNPITSTTMFTGAYNSLISKMTAGGRKGVIANLPYVTTLPHFKTVPYNPVPLDAATANQLNSMAAYGAYNAGITQAFAFLVANNLISRANADAEIAKRTITFRAGAGNAVVIMDEYLTNLTNINPALVSMRQATAEDLIVLPASSFIGTTVGGNPQLINGVSVPLADKWALSKNEISELKTATDAYNGIIQAAATANNLAFMDAKAVMDALSTTGITANNFTLNASFVSGGAFSLDGFHPSPRGYALIANKFIQAINTKYGSNLNGVNLGNYRILFPSDAANF